jgi:hypothetical protein
MPTRFKRDAIALVGLAAVLAFAKYHLARLPVRPFGLDPCDSVNVFAFITIVMVAVVSLFRAFRPHSQGTTSGAVQHVYVIRSQQAFVLAVCTTLTANVVDLARHPSVWVGSVWRTQMLAWLSVYAAVGITMQLLVQAAQRSASQTRRTGWPRVAFVAAGATLVLFVCPEWDIDYSSETAHILTVALGALVLLIPMRVLLPVLVPYDTKGGQSDRVFFSTPREWSPLVIGIVMSALAFWSQSHKLGPYVRPKLISGLAGGVLIAYAFLAEPLGLRPRVGLNEKL